MIYSLEFLYCFFVPNLAGTGTNAAYVENAANVELLSDQEADGEVQSEEKRPSGYMVVNTEWGNFGCRTEDGKGALDFILTDIDRDIDMRSLNPRTPSILLAKSVTSTRASHSLYASAHVAAISLLECLASPFAFYPYPSKLEMFFRLGIGYEGARKYLQVMLQSIFGESEAGVIITYLHKAKAGSLKFHYVV